MAQAKEEVVVVVFMVEEEEVEESKEGRKVVMGWYGRLRGCPICQELSVARALDMRNHSVGSAV